MKGRSINYLIVACMIFSLFTLTFASSALCGAGKYPERTIMLYVPFGAGGATDIAARTLSSAIPDFLGQPVMVVNKPGASGSICMDFVSKQKPDGYSMMMTAIGTNALYVAMNPRLPFSWDAVDYCARTQLNPNMLVVHPSSPFKTFGELAKALKDNPGKYKYSTAGPGCIQHIGAVMILKELGLPNDAAIAIHYDSGAACTLAQVQKEVDFLTCNVVPLFGHVKAGKLRGLAVTTPKRLPDFPDIPTYTELGYPRIDLVGWRGIAGPPGIPDYVVKTWEDAVKKTTQSKYWLKVIKKFGDVPSYQNSKDNNTFVKREFTRYRELFEELGLLVKK